MRAIVFDGELRVVDMPKPAAADTEVLVRINVAGICNTDLEIMKGYRGFQGIIGHEFAGIVDDAPQTHHQWIGKRVVGEINCGCGACDLCHAGLGKHCAHRTTIGISGRAGAFAEYIALPAANLHEIPDGLADEEAVFTEPVAAAFEILEQIRVKSQDKVLVLGDGKLGILCALVLRLTGANITLAGKHKGKLNIAANQGISTVLVRDLPRGQLFDIVVEATGNPHVLEMAMNVTRPRGKIILKSTTAHASPLNLSPLVIHEITLIGSRCGPFAPAIDAIARRCIDVKPFIFAIFPPEKINEAFEAAQKDNALKILVNFRQ
jgi:threonine dehydrogenase-like Zn-dependent dehydrogenase